MAKNLVIVESPAKAKTLKKFLSKDYEVVASYGHVRDLVPKEGAVDPDQDFLMKYEVIEKNAKHVDVIAKNLRYADTLYLATDPDREGEAISWHIYELMREKNLIKDKPVHRVVFHEITKTAILDAMDHPRELSMPLINAQQARRALDYLVGFNLSPLLWKKIRRGLSAGRVQSPALRMIVERELEIERFKSQEYWSITAALISQDLPFNAKLSYYEGKKMEQFTVTADVQAQEIVDALNKAGRGKMVVSEIEKKQRKRNPSPPFITSTLQQEAARKLGFTAQRTMRTAQKLYEGIDIGGETVGLISYMRTDSVNLAEEALVEIREFIQSRYGKENLPDQAKIYKTKSKNAQEAHEAIRPTSVHRTPESLKEYLESDQYKLYNLIWKRTVACQMTPALIDTVSVDLACGNIGVFRATGSTINKPGFIAVYQESKDDDKGNDDDTLLPPMQKGDVLDCQDIIPKQHFTEPPPRYTEASLVKALEEFGIGRPSTYASIISTLQNREYVELDKKRFKPTDVARVVNRFLTEYFNDYVDYDFTAKLEDELDAVSRDEMQWRPLLSSFWGPFKQKVNDTTANVKRSDVTQELMDEKCPKCDKPLATRLGRNGLFVGCTGYPECDYTRNLNEENQEEQSQVVEDRVCPKCEGQLQIRAGKYGKFIGCSNYPKCNFIEPLEKPRDTGVECPQCKKGSLLQRRSKKGKFFFSCSTYPSCSYAIWNEPIAEACPNCHWPVLMIKTTKKNGREKACPQKDCHFSEPMPEEETPA